MHCIRRSKKVKYQYYLLSFHINRKPSSGSRKPLLFIYNYIYSVTFNNSSNVKKFQIIDLAATTVNPVIYGHFFVGPPCFNKPSPPYFAAIVIFIKQLLTKGTCVQLRYFL